MSISATVSNVNTEHWFPVLGYEGAYEFSNLGRLRRILAAPGATVGRIAKPFVTVDGHLRVKLSVGGRCRHLFIHQLILETTVGPCPPGQECRHLNGNPADNRPENLAYGTHTENMADRVIHGTSNRGEQNGCARLTDAKVHEIRKLLAQGLTCAEIGRRFGVDRVAISYIKSGKRWTHVS